MVQIKKKSHIKEVMTSILIYKMKRKNYSLSMIKKIRNVKEYIVPLHSLVTIHICFGFSIANFATLFCQSIDIFHNVFGGFHNCVFGEIQIIFVIT